MLDASSREVVNALNALKRLLQCTARLTAACHLVLQISCAGGDSSGPKVDPPQLDTTAVARGPAGQPTSHTKVAGDAQSALVGATLPQSPSVLIRDANGKPVANVRVDFFVVGGGGSLTGGSGGWGTGDSAISNSAGVATIGSWRLGGTVGRQTLIAWASFAAVADTFTATGIVGPAANMVKSAGDAYVAMVGSEIRVAPRVTVTDAFGNPVSGATVAFTIESGGGSVTGAPALSDHAGVASVGSWKVGDSPGINTLSVSVPGVTPAVFTAIATAMDECATRRPYTIGSSVTGSLSHSDCLDGGQLLADLYATTVVTAGAYVFAQDSSSGDTLVYLRLRAADGTPVAEDDARFKVILPPASYLLDVVYYAAAVETSDYTLSSAETSTAATACKAVFVVRGVSTTQSLETTDCQETRPGHYDDPLVIYLVEGQRVTITMQSTDMDAYLSLWLGGHTELAANDNMTTSTRDAQIVYTPPFSSYFRISPSSSSAGRTGSYVLTIR